MIESSPPPSGRSPVRRFFCGLAALLDGTRRLVLNLLLLLVVALIAALLWQRLHTPALAEKTTLVLDLSGAIVDQPRTGSLRSRLLAQLRGQGGAEAQTRLRDVLAVLDAAAHDEQVTQALLLTDDLGPTGLATLREVAAAIERFKAAGKKVVPGQRLRAAPGWPCRLRRRGCPGWARCTSRVMAATAPTTARPSTAGRERQRRACRQKVQERRRELRRNGPSPETVESDWALYGSRTSWTAGTNGCAASCPPEA
ncbi:MAG: hypothetical protein U1F49_03300 [Rubrivivax sp.]